MFKKVKYFIIGFIFATILFSSITYASIITQKINVSYDNIKIIINGQEKLPPNDMLPFIFNGRVFVSLRYVGESFNKNMKWDGENKTIMINDKIISTNDKVIPIPTILPRDKNVEVDPVREHTVKIIDNNNEIILRYSDNKKIISYVSGILTKTTFKDCRAVIFQDKYYIHSSDFRKICIVDSVLNEETLETTIIKRDKSFQKKYYQNDFEQIIMCDDCNLYLNAEFVAEFFE